MSFCNTLQSSLTTLLQYAILYHEKLYISVSEFVNSSAKRGHMVISGKSTGIHTQHVSIKLTGWIGEELHSMLVCLY